MTGGTKTINKLKKQVNLQTEAEYPQQVKYYLFTTFTEWSEYSTCTTYGYEVNVFFPELLPEITLVVSCVSSWL